MNDPTRGENCVREPRRTLEGGVEDYGSNQTVSLEINHFLPDIAKHQMTPAVAPSLDRGLR